MKIASTIALTLMFILAKQTCFSQNGNIHGKITDTNTREELGGVKITIDGKQVVYSDFDGNFSLQGISAGKHTFQFSSLSYTDYKKEIEISEDETLFIETLLSENELESIAILTAKN